MKKLISIIITSSLIFNFLGINSVSAALDTDQATYHKLDGNSNDAHSDSNGTDTSITYSTGIINNAAVFNGSTSEILFSNKENTQFTGSYTVNVWVKTTSATTQIFVSNWWLDGTKYSGWYIRINSNGTAGFFHSKNTGATSNTDYDYIASTDSVSGGSFHMITARYDGSNITINIDGGDEQNNPCTYNAAYNANAKFFMGREDRVHEDDRYRMNGSVDELGTWDRALSDAEVVELYNSGAGLQYPYGAAAERRIIIIN